LITLSGHLIFSFQEFFSKHNDHPLNPPPLQGGGSPLKAGRGRSYVLNFIGIGIL